MTTNHAINKGYHESVESVQKLSQNENLRSNLMTHTGEKPHECVECGKKFTQKTDLKRHYMAHI